MVVFLSGAKFLNFYVFCSITSDYTLRAMPHLPEGYVAQAEKITTAFLGDPSFFAYNGEEPEPEDPEAPPVERFREVHRLAYTVQVSTRLIIPLHCLVLYLYWCFLSLC